MSHGNPSHSCRDISHKKKTKTQVNLMVALEKRRGIAKTSVIHPLGTMKVQMFVAIKKGNGEICRNPNKMLDECTASFCF